MDVDTRVRPYQPGKETGYRIGGGTTYVTYSIAGSTFRAMVPLLDQKLGKVALQ